MSGKRRRTPGLVRVICTDDYHRDTKEFTRRGFHFLFPMELLPRIDGGFTLKRLGISPAAVAPVKPVHRAEGKHIYEPGRSADVIPTTQLECSCGRDVQRLENKLMDHVMALFRATGAADPLTTRVDLDITTI